MIVVSDHRRDDHQEGQIAKWYQILTSISIETLEGVSFDQIKVTSQLGSQSIKFLSIN